MSADPLLAMVVDTSALLTVLLQEAKAERYLERISRCQRCLVAAPTWLETAIVLQARKGEGAEGDLDLFLQEGPFEIVPFDHQLARHAQRAWQRYGKGRHPAGLNLGDCFSYGLAAGLQLPLLFKGHDFSLTDIAPVLTPPPRR
jgi:ribonuclease VapC